MARFLVVAHQSADSPELSAALRQAVDRDPAATFVPSYRRLLSSTSVARPKERPPRSPWKPESGPAKMLESQGVKVEAVRVGDPDPVEAAADEWNEHPDYDRLILSASAKGTSRWLRGKAVPRLKKRLPIPVTHVVSADR